MCPCPICATIALLLIPFMGYKWAKRFVQKHHCTCDRCQQAEKKGQTQTKTACSCSACRKRKK